MSYRLWPAIAATIITGIGFAALKFVLIGEQALAFTQAHIDSLPFAWMREVMSRCYASGLAKEAITQGLASMLTFGVLLGYLINCPLAGAWRAAPLFALSCVGVGLSALLAIQFNAWAVAVAIGVSYGAACAARGKVIPLLAEGTGRHNTFVSGLMNASLVVGLLVGTVIGLGLASAFIGSPASEGEVAKPATWIASPWLAHVAVAALFALGVVISLQVRTPSCPTIPFAVGMRSLVGDTIAMFRRHWALLVSGGIIWGIAAAASLTVLVWAITEVKMNQVLAGSISVFAAIGAIGGNLISARLNRRRYAVACLLMLGIAMLLIPVILGPRSGTDGSIIPSYIKGALMMIVVGLFFAVPANIVDARLLHLANQEGLPGRGSTVMSLIHNLLILIVGVGLAVPLFLSLITAEQQFWILTGFAVLAAIITLFAELRDEGGTTRRSERPVA